MFFFFFSLNNHQRASVIIPPLSITHFFTKGNALMTSWTTISFEATLGSWNILWPAKIGGWVGGYSSSPSLGCCASYVEYCMLNLCGCWTQELYKWTACRKRCTDSRCGSASWFWRGLMKWEKVRRKAREPILRNVTLIPRVSVLNQAINAVVIQTYQAVNAMIECQSSIMVKANHFKPSLSTTSTNQPPLPSIQHQTNRSTSQVPCCLIWFEPHIKQQR